MNLIRKISIGRDYKNDAMHYSINQEVFGGHTYLKLQKKKTAIKYILKRKMRFYLGKNLIKTWQYQQNLIQNINEAYTCLYC